jgi:O-antigen/teichoic acid export membrane protein
MSRLKKFTKSVLSGYILIGSNAFYTIASIPLALAYLSRPEFGLWTLTVQIGGYIALVDLGMSGSASLILIDHKDDLNGNTYGSTIKTSALVGCVQGFLIFLIGSILAINASALLHVPSELQLEFTWLLVGQSALLGILFSTRIFGHLLIAHQRYDISNHAQSVVFPVSLLVMWLGFEAGYGVFSFLLAQAIGILVGLVVNVWGCRRLRLFPESGHWGEANWERFYELFNFGRDVFFYSIGAQLVNASQTVLLTRFLGLDAAAIWSVCTRTYTMLTMLIWRIQDYSVPALAEMISRQELERLLKRFKEIAVLSANLSVAAGAVLAACNYSFIQLWTHGKISWLPINNLLLALWLVVGTIMRAHILLIVTTKRFRFLRYIFLIEGSLFITLNVLFHNEAGFTGMLAFSILCTLMLSLSYGIWRTENYFKLNLSQLLKWYEPAWQLTWRLALVGSVSWWMTRGLGISWQFLANLLVLGISASFLFLRYGVPGSLRADIFVKLPPRFRSIFEKIAP